MSLASLNVSSIAYAQQPITTSAAVVAAVPASNVSSAKKSFPGCVWLHTIFDFSAADGNNQLA